MEWVLVRKKELKNNPDFGDPGGQLKNISKNSPRKFFGRTLAKTSQTGQGASSSQPVEDDDEVGKSYNPSDDEEDEASAQNTIPMDPFQIEMQTAFVQFQINQEIQEMQFMKILAYQRVSIDRQEVILARLCQRFIHDQGSSGEGGTDFDGRQPTIDGRCREWPGMYNPRPTPDGRPHPTVGGRLDYLQSCLELKKEEQSRATNWGLIEQLTKDTILHF
ncbi:hypothetical protein M9H77_29618 [Catharanthus roseus]|uniref:Uncharacterized protein n=1 Tax=Catharanthus roseus TaxID=4058 RepID=A0ACB9ZVU6_CATRO|nr:hypothetical protein M9H77_29618 [Catharanthus roseus]